MANPGHRVKRSCGGGAFLLPLLVLLFAPVLDASIFGSIRGFVHDQQGAPQVGVLVTLLTPEGKESRQVRTDFDGVFSVNHVLPGQYSLRVAVDRFLPVTRDGIQVKAGLSTLLDVSLRGVFATLQLTYPADGEIRDMSDDWKWVLRTSLSTRPVLRFRRIESKETKSVMRKLAGRFSDTKGYAQLSGGGIKRSALANETDLGTAFAVATSVLGENNIVVSGNMGYGSANGTPAAAFRTSYRREIAAGIAPEVSVTVRQLQMPIAAGQAIYGPGGNQNGPSLETVTLGFSDTARLGDRTRFDYGFLFESVRFLNRLNFVSPYGRLVYELGKNREVQLRYASGVPHTAQRAAVGEDGTLRQEVSSLGMFPRLALRDGRPTVQRAEHIEIAYREEKGGNLLELAVYKDDLNNAALSAMTPAGHFSGREVLPDLFSDSSTLNAGSYQTSGYRVSYARRLRDRLQAAIGYSSTGVLSPTTSQLRTADVNELRRSLKVKRASLVTASVSTTLPRAGTQVVSSYQWSNQLAAIAPDLYNDFASRSDPGLNLVIRQPLPFSDGLPGKLEATGYINNLLKAGYIPVQTFDGQQIFLLPAVRSYRGALSFVF